MSGISKIVHKGQVIDFLVKTKALKFGEFLLKSGRKAPYFINTGCFDDGEKISRLSDFYAAKIVELGLDNVDVIFGPAYKGIPLCVSTAMSLQRNFERNIGFCFNRKEAKTRGEGGDFVGKPIAKGTRVVLVEDVVTAGTTLQEMVPVLREKIGVEVAGVIILVDRAEKGTGSCSAVEEAERDLGIKVTAIVTIHDIISYLSSENSSGFTIDAELKGRIDAYRSEYGVSCIAA
jgi:orotate phosphoribosyltransferase